VNPRIRLVVAWVLVLAAALLMVACQSPTAVVSPRAATPSPAADRVVIHVASNGWHTGIVLPRSALPAGAVPEAEDFPDAPYLEFGWGDAEYYPAPRPTLGMALGAAFVPGPAIVHLVGLPAHPHDVFPKAEVVTLGLSPEGFRGLADYLDATFARKGAQRAPVQAPGLYSFSRFYPATGEFHLFNTCNTWTARGLEAAGLPVRASGTFTAEDLMAQVRAIPARDTSERRQRE
jgi:uncharacterized protein (TIGR02117 family)